MLLAPDVSLTIDRQATLCADLCRARGWHLITRTQFVDAAVACAEIGEVQVIVMARPDCLPTRMLTEVAARLAGVGAVVEVAGGRVPAQFAWADRVVTAFRATESVEVTAFVTDLKVVAVRRVLRAAGLLVAAWVFVWRHGRVSALAVATGVAAMLAPAVSAWDSLPPTEVEDVDPTRPAYAPSPSAPTPSASPAMPSPFASRRSEPPEKLVGVVPPPPLPVATPRLPGVVKACPVPRLCELVPSVKVPAPSWPGRAP